MTRKPDASSADKVDWQQAVAREATIRPLASKRRLSSIELGVACRTLGLSPTWFYELLKQYRSPEPIRGRSDTDYAGMAQSILASSEWAAARRSERSRRDRVLSSS